MFDVLLFISTYSRVIFISCLSSLVALLTIPQFIKTVKVYSLVEEIKKEYLIEARRLNYMYENQLLETEDFLERILFMGQLFSLILEDTQSEYLRKEKRTIAKTK